MRNRFLGPGVWRIALYVFYVVVLTLALVYWRFPMDLFKSWLEDRLTTMTKQPVVISRVKATLPGFQMQGVQVGAGSNGGFSGVRIDSMSADLLLRSWLGGVRSFELSGRLFGGTLRGKALLDGKDPVRLYVKANLSRLEAGRIPLQGFWGKLLLKGQAAGEIDLWFSADPRSNPRGKVLLESRRGEAPEVSLGSLRLPELRYETLKARFDLSEGDLTIEKIEMSGDYGTIQVVSEVRLRSFAPSATAGEAALLLTIKGSSAQKNSFPLLWAVVEKLPRAGGSFRIPLTAAKKS